MISQPLPPSHLVAPELDSTAVGIDVVDIERFTRRLERTPRLWDKILTPTEAAYCATAAHPVASAAARYAAKEAAIKALNLTILTTNLHHIEITPATTTTPPGITLHGPVAERAAELGTRNWTVSLTHDGPCAAAIVAAARRLREPTLPALSTE